LRLFWNRELRIIFGEMRDEIIRSWGKAQNEMLHKPYSWSIKIRGIKSKKMG
jgi:hypothetical protein